MIFCPLINAECKGEECIFWYREKLLDQKGCNLKFFLENFEAVTTHLEEISENLKKLKKSGKKDQEEIQHLEDISLELTKIYRKLGERRL